MHSLSQPAADETTTEPSRIRTFEWVDPADLAAAAADGRSGLEFMQALSSGELPPPPIGAAFGFEVVEVEEGRAVFALEPAEWMENPIGSIHGGVAATLLDSCMGCAVHTTLEAGSGYTTSDLQVRYLRAMTIETGRVLAEGRVIHRGRRLATAEGKITVEATGKVIATGTTGCAIL